MHIVIIGISAAGIAAMTKIRQLDKDIQITALSYEHELPYNKCLLADYLAGIKTEAEVYTKDNNFFVHNNISLILGKKVVHIDADNNQCRLDDNSLISFDTLLLATGLQPFVPPMVGVDVPGVFVFNTVADTNNMLAYVQQNKCTSAVVIGAGLTGIEVADALHAQGLQVTVVESADRILTKPCDIQASMYIQQLMHKAGIALHLTTFVTAIDADGKSVNNVVLNNGQIIPTQLVIVATGARLDRQLFESAGIAVGPQGVIINEYMQTSRKNIFAAGDICAIKDLTSDTYVQSCTWPDAVMQGMLAGFNCVGQPKKYDGALIIANSHFFGKNFYSCGDVNASWAHVMNMANGDSYYRIYTDTDNIVKAFIMIGEPKNLSIIKRAILFKEALSVETLENLFK